MIRPKLTRFWKNEDAAVAFEAVIITPILAWAFVASFVFFDAFRTYNSSIKATYAIADVVSRQDETICPYDIEGYTNIFAHLVRSSERVQIRVSQIAYDAGADEYSVDWSDATNGAARLFDAGIPDIQDDLPPMADAERAILVETFIPYQPAFSLGLEVFSFSNFTITRPRRANQVPFNPDIDAPPCLPVT